MFEEDDELVEKVEAVVRGPLHYDKSKFIPWYHHKRRKLTFAEKKEAQQVLKEEERRARMKRTVRLPKRRLPTPEEYWEKDWIEDQCLRTCDFFQAAAHYLTPLDSTKIEAHAALQVIFGEK